MNDKQVLIARVCSCGAITVIGPDFSNAMRPATFKREFKKDHPKLRVQRKRPFVHCDHCVNHWGIDLCGCGSGEPVGKCRNGYAECKAGTASQIKGEQRRVMGWVHS